MDISPEVRAEAIRRAEGLEKAAREETNPKKAELYRIFAESERGIARGECYPVEDVIAEIHEHIRDYKRRRRAERKRRVFQHY